MSSKCYEIFLLLYDALGHILQRIFVASNRTLSQCQTCVPSSSIRDGFPAMWSACGFTRRHGMLLAKYDTWKQSYWDMYWTCWPGMSFFTGVSGMCSKNCENLLYLVCAVLRNAVFISIQSSLMDTYWPLQPMKFFYYTFRRYHLLMMEKISNRLFYISMFSILYRNPFCISIFVNRVEFSQVLVEECLRSFLEEQINHPWFVTPVSRGLWSCFWLLKNWHILYGSYLHLLFKLSIFTVTVTVKYNRDLDYVF